MPTSLTADATVPIDLRLWLEAPGEESIDHNEVADVRSSASTAEPQPRAAPMAEVGESMPVTSTAPPAAVAPMTEPLVADESMPTSDPAIDTGPAPASAVATESDALTTTAVAEFTSADSASQTTAVAETEKNMLIEKSREIVRKWGNRANPAQPVTWRRDGRRYTVRLERPPATELMDLERVTVIVTTDVAGQMLETRMQMKRLAFSNFTHLVDEWDETMQLHDDEFFGRFHSNSPIQLGWINGVGPRFHGSVSSAARQYVVTRQGLGSRVADLFPDGIRLRAAPIPLPKLELPGDGSNRNSSESRQRVFDRDTQIVFYSDGSYGWQDFANDVPEQRETVGDTPLFLMAKPGVKLRVRGRVRGRVLVFSRDEIEITGDTVYARNVRRGEPSDDFLGLASDRDVHIADPDVTGPGDLMVDAAVYARQRFVVRRPYTRSSSTLSIFGSLSAGTVSVSEPRYAMKVRYDPRFEQRRPPGFPVTNRYDLDSWDGHWSQVSPQ
ncbi:MAG: hypothetical protein R3E77_11750 [Steroidobacteraceae bacterium]